jgi:spore coat polysaccharide biosynthesis protein SpsF (cytidylyltransferase family)
MNVVIVQARIGSQRLPGKVLRDLSGVTVLAHVIARAQAIAGVDLVCCAIPEDHSNDALADAAIRLGAEVSRGPELDVLTRYLIAARSTAADTVMRVTSDCPLLDPVVSGAVLREFLAGDADYVSNLEPRSWPKGLDTEVFSARALERAAEAAQAGYDREHVTPWIRRAPELSRRNVRLETGDCADWRWTLDYGADLEFMKAVLALLPPFPYLPGFEEIRAIVLARPDVAAINADLS